MPDRYRYTGTSWYRNGERLTAGAVVEPTDAELRSFGETLVPVDEDAEGDTGEVTESDPEVDETSGENESDVTRTNYDTYPRSDLEAMDYDALRTLAVEGDHPDVHGNSTMDDIIDAYAEQ